ncbi:MAG TPA: DNA-binding response regulator [Flavobacterium sp.]|jgi:YesN/AraC family two-component response regulator
MSDTFKILIVEDEILIARDIKESLEEVSRNKCVIACSVLEALQIIGEQPLDIALIDIKLRGEQNGIDLGRILLAKDCMPFIYLTSYTDSITLLKAKSTRPSGFLVKPFKINDLQISLDVAHNNFTHRKIDFSYSPEDFIKSDVPFRMQKVIRYIHANLDSKLYLSNLAAIAEMSTFHFARTFKMHLEMTPSQYSLKCKIERAKALLAETQLNVMEVALETGFDNQSYFSQVFKKSTGMTPEYFRKHSLFNKMPPLKR